MPLSRDNHYIPRMYLSRWLTCGKISVYHLLVSHDNVYLWNRESIRRVGCLQNLYVNVWRDEELDNLEHELDTLIESPAKLPFDKICNGEALTCDDWRKVCNYIAIQYVRTPAFYFYIKQKGAKFLEEEIEKLGKQLTEVKEIPKTKRHLIDSTDYLPIDVSITDEKPDDGHTNVKVFAIAGKGIWLFQIKQTMLKDSVILRYFQNLRWNIITAPDGETWPTCDNPVVICDVDSNMIVRSSYSSGIAGRSKAVLFPLSPKIVLLATTKRSYRWHNIHADKKLADMIRIAIVNNAMMCVYSSTEDQTIPKIRPRIVTKKEYMRIKNEFDSWFDSYKEIEGPLLNK